MKKLAQLMLTTVLGGVVFMIPLVVVVLLAGKVVSIMLPIARKLSHYIPVESVAGFALVNVLVVFVTVVICFLAGLAAKSRLGMATVQLIDSKLLEMLPGYAFVRGLAGGVVDDEGEPLKPVLARLDDCAHIAFEIERDSGVVTVYLPGAPNPYSGTVAYMTEDRIELLDMNFKTALKKLRALGRGSSAHVVGPLSKLK